MKNSSLYQKLQEKLRPSELRLDQATRQAHAGDKWFASHLPDAVALPRTTRAVSTILAFSHEHGIPVTARGAGYGYVGGCVPSQGGMVLSLAGMRRIREINAHDFVAVVQPGVLTAQLQDSVATSPPTPAARAASSME
jgi:glycolate oxidase